MISQPTHDHTCPRCDTVWKRPKTLVAVPEAGKHAGCDVQMPIRKNVVLIGFGHKIREKVSPATWAQGLHDGQIYLYARKRNYRGFAKLRAEHLTEVQELVGDGFVLVDKGILVASAEVLKPALSEGLVGLRVGVDKDGDEDVVWLRVTRDGAKRLRSVLPLYKRRSRKPPTNGMG